jgi:hypothetical protein
MDTVKQQMTSSTLPARVPTPSTRQKSPVVPMLNDAPLTPVEKKYCSCLLKVAGKQPAPCFESKTWKHQVGGETCYNPYGVCHASMKKAGGVGRPDCGGNYDFEKMEDEHLEAYARLNKITVPEPYSREQQLANIRQYKQEKYGSHGKQ